MHVYYTLKWDGDIVENRHQKFFYFFLNQIKNFYVSIVKGR